MTQPTGRPRRKLWGPANPQWKGDAAHEDTKRERARHRYELGACVDCGKPGTERHHVDGDPGNNAPENVKVLCRRCHMAEDGRLDALRASGAAALARKSANCPTLPCVNENCGKPVPPKKRRHGRCPACASHFACKGVERPSLRCSRPKRRSPGAS